MSKICIGSMVVEISPAGDFTISPSHHPQVRFRVEHADTDDLYLALGHAIDRWNKMRIELLMEENRKLRALKERP